ncbi:serine/threonine protein kinase [Laspinema olomoucense]|uniref:non-specific serine/threonine protein kinase n=1 Tax=Laspinema olomoucense D3b TaxID=2953688 RepID=A0ABT2NAE0_9CYAN|nr:serine/threonine-protein kinase [Laspinema sp. D3c]MCT7979532.1 serine/threonine protein kinase [Laspinema sp. D3b]MCT7997403.1 serine/threonine protein kinase [Laspinema sp. D3c]
MSYCINPNCIQRENPDTESHCSNCGSPLLICDRYRLKTPLREPNPAYPCDIYEVQDWGEQEWGTAKVMKVLKFTTQPDFVRLFKQEARVLIWLRHPGIPQVEPGGYFILTLGDRKSLQGFVMEKKAGKTLEETIENQGPISETVAGKWLAQLMEIVSTIHHEGLVHRDIKPSNLILTPDGQVQLIDFGSVADRHSRSTRVGTSGYAPPEQLLGDTQPQSDFFAIARTFLYALTGLTPLDFPETPQGQLIWRSRLPDLSPEFAQLLDDLMAPDWHSRPQTAQAILTRLKSFPIPATRHHPTG